QAVARLPHLPHAARARQTKQLELIGDHFTFAHDGSEGQYDWAAGGNLCRLDALAAVAVARDDRFVALTHSFQPLRREVVPQGAIGVDEHRVRRLAHQRVMKAVFVVARETTRRRAADDALVGELRERSVDVGVAAEERLDAPFPEVTTENA